MKQDKIPCGILGATGSVGQKFIQLLQEHPYFCIESLVASERSSGKTYGQACNWQMPCRLDSNIASQIVLSPQEALENQSIKLWFSALDASVALDLEELFAKEGRFVISNAKNHRMHPKVPLVVPEVNADHMLLINSQTQWPGAIVTNPNCSVIGLVLALKPLQKFFGLKQVQVVSMQAISGAGFSGLSANQIFDNVIPFIPGEEEKLATEPQKILGKLSEDRIEACPFIVEATCNRVPVTDGHTLCVSVNLERIAQAHEIIKAWESFYPRQNLPSYPDQVLSYFSEVNFPQPKLHRDLGGAMSVSIGRLSQSRLFDWKFHVVSHNTVRGAAGGALLNAEYLHANGLLGEKKVAVAK